jgi:hypothetical protein
MLSSAFKQPKNAPIILKEVELREIYAHIFRESVMFEKMLKVLGDMTAGCKIGIRYADRTLYIDKPSIFQGAVRWLYGQTRDNIKQYITDEIMGSNGYAEHLQYLHTMCDQVIMYCSTPTMGVILTNELRLAFRNICAANVNLITRISHGLTTMIQIYEDDDFGSVCRYLEHVQRALKTERIILETNIIRFAKYINSK